MARSLSFEAVWGRVASDPTNAPSILHEAGWTGAAFLEHALRHGGIALPWWLLKSIIGKGCHHA